MFLRLLFSHKETHRIEHDSHHWGRDGLGQMFSYYHPTCLLSIRGLSFHLLLLIDELSILFALSNLMMLKHEDTTSTLSISPFSNNYKVI